MGREIGKGAFGRVFIARISDIPGKLHSQIVAIKKLKSESTFFMYIQELMCGFESVDEGKAYKLIEQKTQSSRKI